jgi:NhaP-type Na+/H+ or K+/H+ antiporter
MVLDSDLENAGTLVIVVACTVIMSILLHGVTANPWAEAFGRRSNNQR